MENKWKSGDPMARDEIIKALRQFIHQFDGRDVGDYFVEDVLEAAADLLELDVPPTDMVPKDFHDRCMEMEIGRRMLLEQNAPKWISVKDRLPEYGRYLVTVAKDDGDVIAHTAAYNDLGWWMHSNVGKITHWMPLPEPPKEEEK